MLIEDFKAAVGKFPTGVTIISTSHNKQLYGFTANSFVSVSLKPRLISFCLNKDARSFKIFEQSEYFAINILASDQSDISQHFASNNKDKFLSINYKIGQFSNAPLLEGSLASIECQKYNQFDCGDHYIFIGEVEKTIIDNTKSPLVYFAKKYGEIK